VTFLAPWAALVAAALTVPPIIAFYLLKLRRRPVRVGSVMFWERAVRDAQGNTPWRMVRPSAQLLLQLLALALLLLAFARPVVPGALGGRVMLVLDRSASMNATDGNATDGSATDGAGGVTRFEQARERLRTLAGELAGAGGTRAMVVALGAEALPLTPWTSDRAVLLGALDAVEPTDEQASADALAELVRLAMGDGDEPPGERPDAPQPGQPQRPERLAVVLASDGDLAPPREPLAANVELRLEPVGGRPAGPAGNAGVVAVAAQRQYDDPATVRVFARVLATGPMRRDLPVRLALDGRPVAQTVARLAPADGAEGPTEASVSLSAVAVDAGVLTVLLPGGDLLPADDAASMWLRGAGRPRVLMVIPERELVDPDRPGPPSPVLLIAAVLEAMDLGDLQIRRLSRYEQLVGEGDLPFDAVVFDRVAPRAPAPAPSLHFGPPPPVPDGELPTVQPGALPGTRAVSWRRTHPVMRDLALDQLAVAQPFMADAQPAPDAARVLVLASGERGPLIAEIQGQQHRRIWVGFEPAQSNWPKLVSFPLFIAEAVDYLAMRGSRDAAVSVQAGSMATLELAQPRTSARLLGPRGDLEVRTSAPTARPGVGPFERAGVYLLEQPQPGDQRAIAVNVASEIESRIGTSSEPPAALGELREARAAPARQGGEREVWPWFLLAGLVVLCLEWLFSARSLGR
jgi:hypothetical protein